MKTWYVCLLLVSIAACASPPPPKSPSGEPDPAEQEESEPAKASEKPSSTEITPPSAPTESGNAKPPCPGLQKSRCKVTVGCAWYDQAGKGKCVDE